MANRRISDLQELAGIDLAEQDLFTLVRVAEVDPELKNKKITISGTKQYLNVYYLPRTGGTISGNTTIGGTLSVSSLTSTSGLVVSEQASANSLVVLHDATVNGTISGSTITGSTVQGTSINGVTVAATTVTGATINAVSGNFSTRLSGATITGNNISGTSGVFNALSGVTITGTTVQAATGIFASLSVPALVISGDLTVVSGLVVSGAAQFVSTINTTGVFTGSTITGTLVRTTTIT